MSIPQSIKHTFRNATIPLTLADARAPDAPILLVNDAFCAMSSYMKSDVIGRNCRFMQGTRDNDAARAEVKAAMASGEDTHVLLKNVDRFGREFDNLLFLHHIRTVQSEPLYFLGSQFVVTGEDSFERARAHILSLNNAADQIIDETGFSRQGHRRQLSSSLASLLRSKVLYDSLRK